MATWVIPHERRRKPEKPKPDPAIAAATDTYYRNELAEASGQDVLRSATDWVRARRPHIGDSER